MLTIKQTEQDKMKVRFMSNDYIKPHLFNI